MALTVKALISKLKKMPPNAYVAWQNHDQSDAEVDGFVNMVSLADDSLYEDEGYQELLGDRACVVLNP